MSRVFVDMSTPEIITKKLADAGFVAGEDFELRLLHAYAKRELTIQYEEPDLGFISRLAEHLGISLFFEHRDGRDVLVFTDDNSGFSPIEGEPSVPFHGRGEAMSIFALEGTTQTLPGTYVLKDYNYRTPQVDLVATSAVSEAGKGSVVEYGAHFKTKEEGDHMARVRAEELRATRRVYEGKSDVERLRAGARFTLEGHPKVSGELLVVEVRHRASQVVFGTGKGDERSAMSSRPRPTRAASGCRYARRPARSSSPWS
jgi:type VI secretion system secreted protein VgrG